MKNFLISVAALSLIVGCAQNVPMHYQWNANQTAAQILPLPSASWDRAGSRQNCYIAPTFAGEPDNGWMWNQVTTTGFVKSCTDNRQRVVNDFIPNNVVGTTAPVGYVVPAFINSAGNLGAGALIRGAGGSTINIAGSVASASGGAASATGGSASSRAASSGTFRNTNTVNPSITVSSNSLSNSVSNSVARANNSNLNINANTNTVK